ncbi:uncharacterized protein LOC135817136 isoform X2 [Sycon ciliatum]|uniref:uncharacterized protein LOC135817136 isoform X2 n=1 Tax=Sycon ciliatum TaxID=27933 RepID=UPI0031F6FF3E
MARVRMLTALLAVVLLYCNLIRTAVADPIPTAAPTEPQSGIINGKTVSSVSANVAELLPIYYIWPGQIFVRFSSFIAWKYRNLYFAYRISYYATECFTSDQCPCAAGKKCSLRGSFIKVAQTTMPDSHVYAPIYGIRASTQYTVTVTQVNAAGKNIGTTLFSHFITMKWPATTMMPTTTAMPTTTTMPVTTQAPTCAPTYYCFHGVCVNDGTNQFCSCKPGWRGRTCAEEVYPCDPVTGFFCP